MSKKQSRDNDQHIGLGNKTKKTEKTKKKEIKNKRSINDGVMVRRGGKDTSRDDREDLELFHPLRCDKHANFHNAFSTRGDRTTPLRAIPLICMRAWR